mmetsp:Transcript_68140/g.149704  ORF Transcript_68140/g.149704 Transcript_68140/m.149704 type:complete len:267 (+) Transcript_68140:116-916(+)
MFSALGKFSARLWHRELRRTGPGAATKAAASRTLLGEFQGHAAILPTHLVLHLRCEALMPPLLRLRLLGQAKLQFGGHRPAELLMQLAQLILHRLQRAALQHHIFAELLLESLQTKPQVAPIHLHNFQALARLHQVLLDSLFRSSVGGGGLQQLQLLAEVVLPRLHVRQPVGQLQDVFGPDAAISKVPRCGRLFAARRLGAIRLTTFALLKGFNHGCHVSHFCGRLLRGVRKRGISFGQQEPAQTLDHRHRRRGPGECDGGAVTER